MFEKVSQQVVISEADINAALQHYKRLPSTITNEMPSC
jgi:hypothetical protein